MTNELANRSWEWFVQRLKHANEQGLDKRFRASYGYIFGTCCALQDSLAYLSATDRKLGRKRMELLPTEHFEHYVLDNGHIRWNRSDKMRMYACEFYLNKAQSNIAAALDSITNQWIESILPPPYEMKPELAQYDFFHLLPVSRLRMISVVAARTRRMRVLSPFQTLVNKWERYANLMDVQTASDIVAHNTTIVEPLVDAGRFAEVVCIRPEKTPFLQHVTKDAHGAEVITPLFHTDCLSIISGRVNAYKHLPTGHNDRDKDYHYTEWAITARALLCITLLFDDMLVSVRKKSKVEEPKE